CSFCVSMSTSSTFTLSLPDALPILSTRFEVVGAFGEVVPPYLHLGPPGEFAGGRPRHRAAGAIALQVHHLGQHADVGAGAEPVRSEEHTSELQSRENLVCRLLLEKK